MKNMHSGRTCCQLEAEQRYIGSLAISKFYRRFPVRSSLRQVAHDKTQLVNIVTPIDGVIIGTLVQNVSIPRNIFNQ